MYFIILFHLRRDSSSTSVPSHLDHMRCPIAINITFINCKQLTFINCDKQKEYGYPRLLVITATKISKWLLSGGKYVY